jgi:hypothetical protein
MAFGPATGDPPDTSASGWPRRPILDTCSGVLGTSRGHRLGQPEPALNANTWSHRWTLPPAGDRMEGQPPLALAVSFVLAQRRSAAPMVPLKVLAEPTRRVALIVMLLMGAVVAGYVHFTSLYLQKALHLSALLTGLGLIPATATVMVVSVLLTRRLLARFGTTSLLFAGLFAVGIGQLWLSRIDAGGSCSCSVNVLFTAFGMGLVFPTASVAVTAHMGPGERGLAVGCSQRPNRSARPSV